MGDHIYFNASAEQLEGIQSGSYSDSKRSWGEVFLMQSLFADHLEETIKNFLASENVLFLSEKELELDILTEPVSGLAKMDEIRNLCMKLRYRVLDIKNVEKQGKYLCSDYGYHSADYYEIVSYGCITIVSA